MTTREKVMLQREAYATGLIEHGYCTQVTAETLATKRYPLPTTTRLRVLRLGNLEYRVVMAEFAQHLEFRPICAPLPAQAWRLCRARICDFTSNQMRQIVALFDNPTEEVEDD